VKSDLVYHILKYVALILAAVMALITLVKKTKNDAGQLTRHGKWYYALIILFLAVGLASQIADDRRQARSTTEQLQRNTVLLEQVVRGQYPLQNIRASYQLRVTRDLPGIQKYEERLNTSISQVVRQLSSAKYRQANDIRSAIIKPEPIILFCQNSPLMPSVLRDPEAARLVGALNLRVLLYRKRVAVERWPTFVVTGASALQPDVEMWFSGGDRCIDYRARERQLILRDIGASTNSSQWESSGELLSVLDLRSAQMVIDVHPRRTDQMQGQLLLFDFELFIGPLQALWLPTDRLTPRQLPNGDIVYEFIFPETLEEILDLQRRYGK
jgi:hypothetical protein